VREFLRSTRRLRITRWNSQGRQMGTIKNETAEADCRYPTSKRGDLRANHLKFCPMG